MTDHAIRVNRRDYLAPKVVFVDGIEGCGKTMLAPIVAALDRVELLTYAYEIEYVCALTYLKEMTQDAAAATISMLADVQIYNSMQSREINFRPSDLSSVFKASEPLRYFRRLFQAGDRQAAQRIKDINPILSLTTHKLIAYCEPLFRAFGDRAVLIEVVRHPLYMIIQNTRNFEGLISTPTDFTIHYEYRDRSVPFYAYGWEDQYLEASPIDRSIYYIEHLTVRSQEMRTKVRDAAVGTIITVPFEEFVLRPDPYMKAFEDALGTKVTAQTTKMMNRQKVPRAKYADSLDLPVYRRCGWEPPKAGLSERQEFEYRRIWLESQASPAAMQVFDRLCDAYEATYMGGSLRANGVSYLES